jgi:hypothetical protein
LQTVSSIIKVNEKFRKNFNEDFFLPGI